MTVKVKVMSFGFSHGIPEEASYLFDARILPNPYHVPELKQLNGLDARVQAYVMDHPEPGAVLDAAEKLIMTVLSLHEQQGRALTVCFGCYGGHHRSVSIAERLFARLTEKGIDAEIIHRDLEISDD